MMYCEIVTYCEIVLPDRPQGRALELLAGLYGVHVRWHPASERAKSFTGDTDEQLRERAREVIAGTCFAMGASIVDGIADGTDQVSNLERLDMTHAGG
jgi:hypothetical protein